MTAAEREEIEALRKERAVAKRVNEVLTAGSAFFAAAEQGGRLN